MNKVLVDTKVLAPIAHQQQTHTVSYLGRTVVYPGQSPLPNPLTNSGLNYPQSQSGVFKPPSPQPTNVIFGSPQYPPQQNGTFVSQQNIPQQQQNYTRVNNQSPENRFLSNQQPSSPRADKSLNLYTVPGSPDLDVESERKVR